MGTSEKEKKKIRQSLSKSSIRNPDTDYYDRVGKRYGEKWKKERELEESRKAEKAYANKNKKKRFNKIKRRLASTDKK